MGLCQPDNLNFSCGACCGLFNLKLSSSEYEKILTERTRFMESSVDFEKPWTVSNFRKKREKEEENHKKNDETIYNCPYLGYIDDNRKKIGCMIHPGKTKNPLSQNFSFYGASICQGYICKNIDRDTSSDWESIFISMNLDSYMYSELSADHITIECIEGFFKEKKIPIKYIFNNYSSLIKEILLHKFNKSKTSLLNMTSFELDMNTNYIDNYFDKLVLRLDLMPADELYNKLIALK